MANYFTREELQRLRDLRSTLLRLETRPPNQGAPRYWKGEDDLELYDRTFGARIGWKWEAVLDDLEQRERIENVVPKSGGLVVDWACGSGVAARAIAARAEAGVRWATWDRNSDARRFAAHRMSDLRPKDEVRTLHSAPESDKTIKPDLLLISHVLDELEDGQVSALIGLVRRSKAVIWVEPGSRVTSRRLSGLREELMQHLHIVGPCPHAALCPMLSPVNDPHWCHHFGKSPGEAFTEGRWNEFGRELDIDLRSLPYSYLALASEPAPTAPIGSARLLGRPRTQRGTARIDLCREDGLHEARLLQRLDKPLFKGLTDPAGEPYYLDVDLEGDKVTRIERV